MNSTTTETTAPDFNSALAAFVAKNQAVIDAYFAANYTNLVSPILTLDIGKRYVRVWRQDRARNAAGEIYNTTSRSAHAFIDMRNGDVLKPATWKAPAKHARGNIYTSTDHTINPNGGFIAYMK